MNARVCESVCACACECVCVFVSEVPREDVDHDLAKVPDGLEDTHAEHLKCTQCEIRNNNTKI